MQTSNYWQQFLNTGKIEDYLNYKAHPDTENLQSLNREHVQGIVNKNDGSESLCKNSLL